MSLENLTKETFLEILDKAKDKQSDAIVINVGEVSYPEIFEIEKQIAHEKTANPEYKDVILLMEHPPAIDFGRNPENNFFIHEELKDINPYTSLKLAKEKLARYGLGFNISERAGGPAYLGPGQLNVHILANCKKVKIKGPRDGQHKLDLIMQDIAKKFGIYDVCVKEPLNESDKRDVYLAPFTFNKSGTLGTKLGSKVAMFTSQDFNSNVMYNGFSFFLKNGSTKGFEFIPACGYSKAELEVASLQEVLEARKIKLDMRGSDIIALMSISVILGYRSLAIYDKEIKDFHYLGHLAAEKVGA